jgi:hypothetical protein
VLNCINYIHHHELVSNSYQALGVIYKRKVCRSPSHLIPLFPKGLSRSLPVFPNSLVSNRRINSINYRHVAYRMDGWAQGETFWLKLYRSRSQILWTARRVCAQSSLQINSLAERKKVNSGSLEAGGEMEREWRSNWFCQDVVAMFTFSTLLLGRGT